MKRKTLSVKSSIVLQFEMRSGVSLTIDLKISGYIASFDRTKFARCFSPNFFLPNFFFLQNDRTEIQAKKTRANIFWASDTGPQISDKLIISTLYCSFATCRILKLTQI